MALRRISNAPMHAGWPNGRQTGAITERIYNGYASFGLTFVVYVEGAQEVVSVNMPEFGQEVAFNIPNVADNGPGALQTIVFNWSRDNCANGKEFSVPVDVLPGQTVDVGPSPSTATATSTMSPTSRGRAMDRSSAG